MKEVEEVWEELTYDQRLAATAVVFKKIWAHMCKGGTYRFLIYDRLGFDMDAYSVLFPEGLNISNFISEANSSGVLGDKDDSDT